MTDLHSSDAVLKTVLVFIDFRTTGRNNYRFNDMTAAA